MKRIHASLLGVVLALGLAGPATLPAFAATPPIPGASAQILPDFADLVEKYGPAVVNINTQTRASRQQALPGLSEDDPFYEFFRRFMPPEGQGNTPNVPNTPRRGQPNPRGEA